MIEKIVVHKDKIEANKEFKFLADSKLFSNESFSKDGQSLEVNFSKGLNILIGKNGSGKSSILKLIGNALAAYQGGSSTYTNSWCRGASLSKSLLGFDLYHDNQPIMYFDATHVVGVVGGSFDDDFFNEGILDITSKGSSGQKSASRLNSILGVMVDGTGFPEQFKENASIESRRKNNAEFDQALKDLERFIIATDQKTIILDEPENHLDLKSSIGFWHLVHHFLKRNQDYQIIVSSHSHIVYSSIFSYANFIEFSANYYQETKAELDQFDKASRA